MKEQAANFQDTRADINKQLESGDFAQYAEQKATSHDQSWSYVTDEQGRKHRIGKDDAKEAALTAYINEQQSAGLEYGENPDAHFEDDYSVFVDSELERVKDEKIASLLAARAERTAGVQEQDVPENDTADMELINDLVNIDENGRGHRPDGKLLSKHEMETIADNQDQIRDNQTSIEIINKSTDENDPFKGKTVVELQNEFTSDEVKAFREAEGINFQQWLEQGGFAGYVSRVRSGEVPLPNEGNGMTDESEDTALGSVTTTDSDIDTASTTTVSDAGLQSDPSTEVVEGGNTTTPSTADALTRSHEDESFIRGFARLLKQRVKEDIENVRQAVRVRRERQADETSLSANERYARRNRIAAAVSGLALFGTMFGGAIASSTSAETTAPAPVETTADDGIEDDATSDEVIDALTGGSDSDEATQGSIIDDESAINALTGTGDVVEQPATPSPNEVVMTLSVPPNETDPGNGNVWDQVERAISGGDYMSDTDPRQAIVSQLVNQGVLSVDSDAGNVQSGQYQITQEMLDNAGLTAEDLDLAA